MSTVLLRSLECRFQLAIRLTTLSLILATWLQASPMLRWMLGQLTPTGPLAAIVIRIGGVSAALLGGAHAVSGATNPTFDGPFEVNATVGTSLNFRLDVVPYQDRFMTSFSASNLPPGITIVRIADNLARLSGTPTQSGTFFSTVYGWRYSPASNPDNYSQDEINGVSDTVTFTIVGGSSPPTITVHPQSQRRLPGTNAVFTVTATSSTPLSYHWRKGSAPFASPSTASLTLTNLTTNDVAVYSVIVSNSAGTLTSSGANLSLATKPIIVPSMVGPAVRLGFNGETGVTYRVESSTNVAATTWSTVTNLTPTLDGPLAVTNTPASSNLFYRLRLLGP